MSMHKLPEGGHSRNTQPVFDMLQIGNTRAQRSAEIMAALRSILRPNANTHELTRPAARLFSRLMMSLPGDKTPFNFVPVRDTCITELVRQSIPPHKETMTIVEVAAGFSTRGLQLAHMLPHAQIIEVDLPAVLAEKQARLQRANHFAIPRNLKWLAADLGQTSLKEVLDGKPVDVVAAEGLLPYFAPENITRIAASIYESLVPNGIFVADILYEKGLHEVEQTTALATKLFMRQVGSMLGIVGDEATARQLFTRAGYKQVNVYHMPHLSKTFDEPLPVPDVAFLIAARKTSLMAA